MIDSPHISLELMEILTRINDNVNEVKERLARIEGQDHADTFNRIQLQLEKERDARVRLEIELASVRTKLAPIVIGISMAGATILQLFVKTF